MFTYIEIERDIDIYIYIYVTLPSILSASGASRQSPERILIRPVAWITCTNSCLHALYLFEHRVS